MGGLHGDKMTHFVLRTVFLVSFWDRNGEVNCALGDGGRRLYWKTALRVVVVGFIELVRIVCPTWRIAAVGAGVADTACDGGGVTFVGMVDT